MTFCRFHISQHIMNRQCIDQLFWLVLIASIGISLSHNNNQLVIYRSACKERLILWQQCASQCKVPVKNKPDIDTASVLFGHGKQ
jgi:hypothetical protein